MITKEQLEDVDFRIGQLLNLADALSIVGFELAGLSIPDSETKVRRAAACAVIDGLCEKAAEMSEKFNTLYVALNEKEAAA